MESPRDIYAEATGYELTYDRVEQELPAELDDADLERLGCLVREATPADVAELKRAVAKFPEVPQLWNYLAVAHQVTGAMKQSRRVQKEMWERHPGYLFARIAEAEHRLKTGRAHEVPGALGESMTLREVMERPGPPHISEWKYYYMAVARWYIADGRLGHAEQLLAAMRRTDGAEDAVEGLEGELMQARLEEAARRIARDKERRVEVDPGPVPDARSRTPRPEGLSAEVEALYRHGFDIPAPVVEAVKALPRERALEDLRRVLRDSIANGAFYHRHPESIPPGELAFGLHALFLLSELGAVEARRDMFDFLGQHEVVLHDSFGDAVSWQPLIGFLGGGLADVAGWMKEPGHHFAGRCSLSAALQMLAVAEPDRRGEVIDVFRDLLGCLCRARAGDGVLDTRVVSVLVSDAVALRAPELEGVVREAYEGDLVEEFMVGTLEDSLKSIALPPGAPEAVPTMLQFYRKNRSRLEWAPEEEEAGGWSRSPGGGVSGARGAPAKQEKEPGRNDPCPCGSGKKFKKCCLR